MEKLIYWKKAFGSWNGLYAENPKQLAFCSFSFIKCLADDNCGWADQYEFLALSPNAGKAWVSPI